jgi:AraC family transcriptional regulator, arabinose operon regulatory protein
MRSVDQDNDPLVATLSGAYWETEPGYWTTRQKGATSWLLILTLSGSGRFTHREGNFDTERGDAVLMRPKRMHEYGMAPGQKEWGFFWVHFHLRQHWVNLLQWTAEGPGMMRERLPESELEEVAEAIRLAIEAQRGSGRFSDTLGLNHLERALIQIASLSPAAQGQLDGRIRTSIAQMKRSLGTPISISELADAVGLSESRFAHLFTQETGVSPRKYLERLRVDRSKQLLELTDLSIREVSVAIGFASEFYFSQRFKALTGERPYSFRLRIRR